MSFNKYFVPEKKQIQKLYEADPKGYIRIVTKRDAFIGKSEDVDFLQELIESHNKKS